MAAFFIGHHPCGAVGSCRALRSSHGWRQTTAWFCRSAELCIFQCLAGGPVKAPLRSESRFPRDRPQEILMLAPKPLRFLLSQCRAADVPAPGGRPAKAHLRSNIRCPPKRTPRDLLVRRRATALLSRSAELRTFKRPGRACRGFSTPEARGASSSSGPPPPPPSSSSSGFRWLPKAP